MLRWTEQTKHGLIHEDCDDDDDDDDDDDESANEV
jgi:hypothetical protein